MKYSGEISGSFLTLVNCFPIVHFNPILVGSQSIKSGVMIVIG